MSDYWKDNGLTKPASRVVCAANKNKESGRIICGARHWDAIMRSQVKDDEGFGGNWTQGFINQFGEFLTREEAYIIAKEQGQIIHPNGTHDDKTLFSECLY